MMVAQVVLGHPGAVLMALALSSNLADGFVEGQNYHLNTGLIFSHDLVHPFRTSSTHSPVPGGLPNKSEFQCILLCRVLIAS